VEQERYPDQEEMEATGQGAEADPVQAAMNDKFAQIMGNRIKGE
jgi:hypothetical protein